MAASVREAPALPVGAELADARVGASLQYGRRGPAVGGGPTDEAQGTRALKPSIEPGTGRAGRRAEGRPPRSLPPIRFFSSARDAARARRPSDLVLLVAAGAGLALAEALRGGTALTRALIAFIDALPGLFGWFWELSYDLAAAWALLLVVVALFARRLALVGDQVLALSVVLVLGAVLTDDGASLVAAITSSDPPAVFPASRIALITAAVVTTSPHLALPFRRVGRWLVILGVASAIALGTARPVGILAALALGTIGAMAARLAFGTPGGRPTRAQVSLALSELGVPALDVRPAELESRGVVLVRATSPDGRPLLVKVFGRDARDGRLLATMWGNLWYRDDTSRLAFSRRQQVEHEAFLTLLAEREGVPVTPVVSAGVTSDGDALVVVEAEGTPLSRIDAGTVGEEALRGLWDALDRLHASGIAHGRIDATRLLLLSDGRSVRIADLAAADRNTSPSLLRADEASSWSCPRSWSGPSGRSERPWSRSGASGSARSSPSSSPPSSRPRPGGG
jgi:hypothetical protein